MLTDAQVKLLRRKRMEGMKQEAAAAASGMSVRSARTWKEGPLPSSTKEERHWRTRQDPFEGVFESEVVPLLEGDEQGRLQAKTILEELIRRHPGEFVGGQARTLQRRVRDWRALHGPERVVCFQQEHVPGREAAIDFTHGASLGVTVMGTPFAHLLFALRLSFSGWQYAELAFGETFEALLSGLQNALWRLGGVPSIGRTDNLSAATHELRAERGRGFNRRWQDALDHYGLKPTRINPGCSNENGIVEKGHDLLKTSIEQALILRGSRDFASSEDYAAFVQLRVDALNARSAAKLIEEKGHLRPLPPRRLPDYTSFEPKVRLWSTIRVGGRTYSVPSRLIGHEVEARQYADVVRVYYKGTLVETMPRIRKEDGVRIDYRHIAWSLVRKPGAFARYRYREELFPTLAFRRAYDALTGFHGERADVEYVRILHLAASTMQSTVEIALALLLDAAERFDYAAVKTLADPKPATVPDIQIGEPDLSAYDRLLGAAR